jgi:hypothetical protein
MNDDAEQFERHLSRQPMRPIPGEWRSEIVERASSRSRLEKSESEAGRMPVLLSTCRDLFWPCPQAWAGLAAVWIFIFAVNFSLRHHDKTPVIAERLSPPSPEVIAQLQQQRLLFAQLMGMTETHDTDRKKTILPGPRSECDEKIMMT